MKKRNIKKEYLYLSNFIVLIGLVICLFAFKTKTIRKKK